MLDGVAVVQRGWRDAQTLGTFWYRWIVDGLNVDIVSREQMVAGGFTFLGITDHHGQYMGSRIHYRYLALK